MGRHPQKLLRLRRTKAMVHRRDLPSHHLRDPIVLALLNQLNRKNTSGEKKKSPPKLQPKQTAAANAHHSGRKSDTLRRQRLGNLRRDLRGLLLGRRRRRRGRRRGVGLLALGVLGGLGLALEEVEDTEFGGLRWLRWLRLL